MGLAPGAEPAPGSELTPDGDPADTVPETSADPEGNEETITGVDRPPGIGETPEGVDIAGVIIVPSSGLGLETKDRETKIEPPHGAEEKVGDQPGEKTSGSVGVENAELLLSGEVAGEVTALNVEAAPDGDLVGLGELAAVMELPADVETLLGGETVPGMEPTAIEDPDGEEGPPLGAET